VLDKLDVVSRVVSKTAGCVLKISYKTGKPVFNVLYNGIKAILEFFPSSSPTILYSTLVPLPQLNLKSGTEAFKEAMAKGETPVTKLLDADGKIITDADGNTLVKAITKDGEEVHLVEKVGGSVPTELLTRGINKTQFFESVTDFKNPANGLLGDQAWDLWKQQKWSELEELFKSNNLNFDSRRNVHWPPNRGFIDFTKETLGIGKEFDRYGGYFENGVFKDGGDFVSPKGASFESRALPKQTLKEPYRKYKVIKEIPEVKKGTSAPWFGQPGLGIQYELPYPIDELLKGGYIILIN
jgi:hypothetical protein